MDNVYRRNQILDILKAGAVETQAELRRKLAQRGVQVTQATVSRDIEELGLVKTREGYQVPDAPVAPLAPPQPSLAVILKEFVRGVKEAGNLVVIRTHPGTAQSVAIALDNSPWEEVVGTVAGDDTIFMATPGASEAKRVSKQIMAYLEE